MSPAAVREAHAAGDLAGTRGAKRAENPYPPDSAAAAVWELAREGAALERERTPRWQRVPRGCAA